MKDVKLELLNESNIRQTLRDQFPKIDQLESLDHLKDLKLTGINTRTGDSFMGLWYEAVATEDFYPHTRSRMIEAGIGSKNNVIRFKVGNDGKNNEYEELQLSSGQLQTFVKIYNPNYNSED